MEGSELSSQEKEIFEALKLFNAQKTLYEAEEADKAHYKSCLEGLLENVAGFAKENPKQTSLLVQIYNILHECNKRLKFSQLFDNTHIEALIPYNLAYFYQQTAEPQNALTHITIAVVELENALRLGRGSPAIASLPLQLLLAQFYLQATALYSQSKEHAKALKRAEQGLALITSIIRGLPDRCESLSSAHKTIVEKMNGHTQDLLAAIEEQKQSLQKRQIPAFKFFNWTHNTENQQKYFSAQSSDGGKLHADWLEKHAIADIMFLSLVDLAGMARLPPMEEVLIRLVNLLAVACYCIATEKRILGNLEVQRASTEESEKLKEMHKNSQLRHNNKYIESEFYYTQSIEVLHAFLHKSLIKNSLISGYNTHYAPTINHITEEEDASYTVSRLDKKPFMGLSNLSLIEQNKEEELSPPSARNLFPQKACTETFTDEAASPQKRSFLQKEISKFELEAPRKERPQLQKLDFSKKFNDAVKRYNISFDLGKPDLQRACSLTDRGLTRRAKEKVPMLPSPVLQKTMIKTPALNMTKGKQEPFTRKHFMQKPRTAQNFLSPLATDRLIPKQNTCKCCAIYRRGKPNEECFYHKIAAIPKLKLAAGLGEPAWAARTKTTNEELEKRLKTCRSKESLLDSGEGSKKRFFKKKEEEVLPQRVYQLSGMTKTFGNHTRSQSMKNFAQPLPKKYANLQSFEKNKNFFNF